MKSKPISRPEANGHCRALQTGQLQRYIGTGACVWGRIQHRMKYNCEIQLGYFLYYPNMVHFTIIRSGVRHWQKCTIHHNFLKIKKEQRIHKTNAPGCSICLMPWTISLVRYSKEKILNIFNAMIMFSDAPYDTHLDVIYLLQALLFWN